MKEEPPIKLEPPVDTIIAFHLVDKECIRRNLKVVTQPQWFPLSCEWRVVLQHEDGTMQHFAFSFITSFKAISVRMQP